MRNLKNILTGFGLSFLLSACGFQLRGTGNDTQDFTLKELNVTARNRYGEAVTQLKQMLRSQGIIVSSDAPYTLMLTNEKDTKSSSSYTSSGRSVEHKLTTTINYEIRDENNLLLLKNQIEASDTYSQDTNNLVGSDLEATQLRGEIHQQLLNGLLRRLRSITPEQLNNLEQKAEAQAQAERDAAMKAQELEKKEQEGEPLQSPIEFPN